MAPDSRPVTLTTPELVTLSLPDDPLSVASVSDGAAAVPSSVKVSALVVETLPATSVWRTSTFFAPLPVSVKLVPVPVV